MNKRHHTIKLLLSYNIVPERTSQYYEFMLDTLIPRMQSHGLHMVEAWHTVFGDRPQRLVVMSSRDIESLERALQSADWEELENQLQDYVTSYQRRRVASRRQFQFFNSHSTELH